MTRYITYQCIYYLYIKTMLLYSYFSFKTMMLLTFQMLFLLGNLYNDNAHFNYVMCGFRIPFINTKDALCWIYKYHSKQILSKPKTKWLTNHDRILKPFEWFINLKSCIFVENIKFIIETANFQKTDTIYDSIL